MISVKVTKIDNTAKVLADLRNKQISFVATGGQIIRTEMATRAPVDTSDLRNSIISEPGVINGSPMSETGPTAKHAEYVEHGTGIYREGGGGRSTPWSYQDDAGNWHTTSGMHAQPFAEPGFQASIPQIDKLAERALKE